MPIEIKTGNDNPVLSRENFNPKNPISKVSIGIFKVEKAPRYIKMFLMLHPFL
jgi:hypothetical protein